MLHWELAAAGIDSNSFLWLITGGALPPDICAPLE